MKQSKKKQKEKKQNTKKKKNKRTIKIVMHIDKTIESINKEKNNIRKKK